MLNREELRRLWLVKNYVGKKFKSKCIMKIGYYTKVPMSYVQAAGKVSQKQKESSIKTIISNDFAKIQFDQDNDYEIDLLLDNMVDELGDLGQSIFAGVVSAIASRAASQPLQVLKHKYQLQPVIKDSISHIENVIKPKHSRLLQIVRTTYAEKGIKGLYKDHSVTQLVGIFQNVTVFGVYENVRPGFQLSPIAHSQNACNFASGLIAGFFSALVCQPLEMISTRQIARRTIAKQFGISSAAKSIFQLGGLRIFYRSTLATVLHVSPLCAYKFLFYNWFCDEMMSELATDETDKLEEVKSLGAGAMAGVLSTFIVYPSDMVRRLLLLDAMKRQRYRFDFTCRNIMQCYSTILRRDGILGFYKGLTPCLLRTAVNTGVSFTVYYMVRKWADEM